MQGRRKHPSREEPLDVNVFEPTSGSGVAYAGTTSYAWWLDGRTLRLSQPGGVALTPERALVARALIRHLERTGRRFKVLA